jgi:hypothetical protein
MTPLTRCDCGVLRHNVGQCPNCGRGYYDIDPVKKLRRKIENTLRNSEDKVIIKTAEFLGVK